MKILVCGVPFGRDNVGDEAILACIVKILNRIAPEAEITASTDDQETTEELLNIRTCPLFGHHEPEWDPNQMERELKRADLIIWGGATGLSDYPEFALQIFEKAQHLGKPTAMFCTGMNNKLNPFLYSIAPGIKRDIQSWVGKLSGGMIDPIKSREAKKSQKAFDRIRHFMDMADSVIVRDEQSCQNLVKIGVPNELITVGCDPAILLSPKKLTKQELEISNLSDNKKKRIGICISSQSPIKDLRGLAQSLDRIIKDNQADLYMIPMNPYTDRDCMNQIKGLMKFKDQFHEYQLSPDPEVVTGFAAEMDLVISSRLHLLILSSISKTPIIGISRGTKVDYFLKNFDLKPAGSVNEPDFEGLEIETTRLLNDSSSYVNQCEEALPHMHDRLEHGIQALEQLIRVIDQPGFLEEELVNA